jgi:hypothetical protein
MKRFLAYLFIVLGLGLTFNVSAKADVVEVCEQWSPNGHSFIKYFSNIQQYENREHSFTELEQRVWNTLNTCSVVIKSKNKKLYDYIYKKNKRWTLSGVNRGSYFTHYIKSKKFKKIYAKYPQSVIITGKEKTYQIAKVEPSQTQEAVHEIEFNFCKTYYEQKISKVIATLKSCDKHPDYKIAKISEYNKYLSDQRRLLGTSSYKYFCLHNKPKSNLDDLFGSMHDCKKNGKDFINVSFNGSKFWSNEKYLKTQIAKVEPSQTQKAVENFFICLNKKGNSYTPYFRSGAKCNKENDIEVLERDDWYWVIRMPVSERSNPLYSKLMKIYHPKLFNSIMKNKNLIVKEEPTITPKKKVKVVKKEPQQEEFKPENKDNEAPVIEIAEAITVNDSTYEIEGKVIDKSKKLFVQIDGETIPVKKGKFKIKRFSPVDEQLQIVALDQWGNKSKPKLVNITIDLKETELAEKLEQLNPSLIKSKSNKNRVALIIGIEKYEQTPAANFANLDAQYFYEYARKGFGIPKSNIKLLVDEDADLVKSISSINKWLPSKIKKNKTELIIFFAGHGLASNNGQELYILPQDSDPDLLSRTALSRTELFEQIISLSPKSVTMFMDTCYSGISRDEKMLLASARPIRIVADDQEGIPDNFTIFTASKLDQISSGLKEANHGIFSYYLMKGLEGNADSNQDKKITNGELLAYMDENVSQKASELGRQQNPSLAGDPDKILMSYR